LQPSLQRPTLFYVAFKIVVGVSDAEGCHGWSRTLSIRRISSIWIELSALSRGRQQVHRFTQMD
jgi:hypothetical protein